MLGLVDVIFRLSIFAIKVLPMPIRFVKYTVSSCIVSL